MQMLENPICLKNMFVELPSPSATGCLHLRLVIHHVQDASEMQPTCSSEPLAPRPGSQWEMPHKTQSSLDEEQLVRDDSFEKENGVGGEVDTEELYVRTRQAGKGRKKENTLKKKEQLRFAL